MNISKIYRQKDGSRVRVTARAWFDASGAHYQTSVFVCPKGKRKFIDIINTDEYEYRKLSMQERETYSLLKQVNAVGASALNEVRMLLWDSFKPSLIV